MVVLRNPLMLRGPRGSSDRAKTRQPGRELTVLSNYEIEAIIEEHYHELASEWIKHFSG